MRPGMRPRFSAIGTDHSLDPSHLLQSTLHINVLGPQYHGQFTVEPLPVMALNTIGRSQSLLCHLGHERFGLNRQLLDSAKVTFAGQGNLLDQQTTQFCRDTRFLIRRHIPTVALHNHPLSGTGQAVLDFFEQIHRVLIRRLQRQEIL